MNELLIHICIKKIIGVRSTAMILVRTTILTLKKKWNLDSLGPSCKNKNKNYVEFDFSIGSCIFSVFINKQKKIACEQYTLTTHPQN